MKKIIAIRGQRAASILAILKQVATNDDRYPLHEIHLETFHALAAHLFQTNFDPDAPAVPISRAGEVVGDDHELAMEVMNMAGILPFVEEPHEAERIEAVGRLGDALGLDRKFAKRLHQLSHEAVTGMAIFARAKSCCASSLSRERPMAPAPFRQTAPVFENCLSTAIP